MTGTALAPAAKPTRSEQAVADLAALLRSRHVLISLDSREELRSERSGIIPACGQARMPVEFWDCATGHTDSSGKQIADRRDPNAMLDFIGTVERRCCFVLRDLHAWWKDPVVQRKLRSLARSLEVLPADKAKAIILLTPGDEPLPPDIATQATAMNFPLPERSEIATIAKDIVANLQDDKIREAAAPPEVFDKVVDSGVGLTSQEFANCVMLSLVATRRVDPMLVAREKKRVIARDKLVTWIDPDPRGLAAIGGNQRIKDWCMERQLAHGPDARDYGLAMPRGLFAAGQPGCGKSLFAKCIGTTWGWPTVKLDFGALKNKFVGGSEERLRRVIALIDALGRVVVWIDEADKVFGGSDGPAAVDGGVQQDQLGTFLQWTQDRTGEAFLIATANEVANIPAALLRRPRFDVLFFVDLPTLTERKEIIIASMLERRRNITEADALQVARATAEFTGSEIASLVQDGMFRAFAAGRDVTVDDLIGAARRLVPLSKTSAEKITALREWAKGRAELAGKPEPETVGAGGRSIDL